MRAPDVAQCVVYGREGVRGAGGRATESGEVARRGCLFAWNFSVTRAAVFTETERRTKPITTLSLCYDSPTAYRLKIQPAKNHALHYSLVMSIRPSVRPHISARLPLDGFP